MTKPPSPKYSANVRLELVNTLYRQSPPILFGNVAVVTLSVILLWHEVARCDLLVWATAIYALTTLRVAVVWRDRMAGGHDTHTARCRARRYTLLAGLSGCLWGTMGVLFFAPDNPIVTVLTCIVLAGMTGGSVASLSSWWPTYVAYALPTVLPFSIRSFAHGTALFSVLGVLSLFLLAVNLAFSRNLQRTVRDAVLLRFENTELIRQLTEEKERAEFANRSKSQFLAAASHDLRQPTHALGLYIATLRAIAEQPDIDRHALGDLAERLGTALSGMSQLLNVLLDISKLDAGVIEVDAQRFALQREFDALHDRFAHSAHAKGLTLTIRATPLWVDTDIVLLHNMLSNLVSNAIRYTRRGRILVAARRRDGNVEIQVFDSGIGIAAAELSNIFREFYQIDNAARDREQGLGLGLAIVKRTATLLGASVRVDSLPGKGSRFSVCLPMAGRMSTARSAAAPHLSPAIAATVSHGKRTVLVVDDDRDVLDSMRLLLSTRGHTVCIAATIEQAMQAADQCGDALDLIVTDFRLAGGASGVDVIRAVHAGIGRAIPAVLITGDTSAEGIGAAASSGFRVLHKPLDPDVLQAWVEASRP